MTRPNQVKINEATATAEQRDLLKKWGKNRKAGGTLVQRFIDAGATYRDFRKKEDGCNPANYDLFKEDLAGVIYSRDDMALMNRPTKSLDDADKKAKRELQQKAGAYMGFMYTDMKKLQVEKTDMLAKAIEESLREKLDAIKSKAQKHEGDCTINLSDFTRDINNVYETYFGKKS
tara:strand:+ start:116 stop:640 length:525 start_codon:yes stop_codon:yes gene_type:complete